MGFVALLGFVGMATYIIWGWLHKWINPVPPEPSIMSIAKGKVIYTDAGLLGDVTMMMLSDKAVAAMCRTTADGSFEFPELPVGTYLLMAYRDFDKLYWLEGALDVVLSETGLDQQELVLSLMPEEEE
jgi:hypothetical protein